MKKISTIPKNIQKVIHNFLESNYGFTNLKYISTPKNNYFISAETSVEINKRPVIGAGKDVYHYSIHCHNLNATSFILKSEMFNDFISEYIRDINNINYVVRNEKGDKVNTLSFSNFTLTLYDGLIDDLTKPFEPFIGFWINTQSGEKLSYVVVKSDHSVVYGCKECPITEFKHLLINDYCNYIAKFDEYFERDGLEKTYDERVNELKDLISLKEMIAF